MRDRRPDDRAGKRNYRMWGICACGR